MEEKEVFIYLVWYFYVWSWFNVVIGKGILIFLVFNEKFYVLFELFFLVWLKFGLVFNVGVEFLCRIYLSSFLCCILCYLYRLILKL